MKYISSTKDVRTDTTSATFRLANGVYNVGYNLPLWKSSKVVEPSLPKTLVVVWRTNLVFVLISTFSISCPNSQRDKNVNTSAMIMMYWQSDNQILYDNIWYKVRVRTLYVQYSLTLPPYDQQVIIYIPPDTSYKYLSGHKVSGWCMNIEHLKFACLGHTHRNMPQSFEKVSTSLVVSLTQISTVIDLNILWLEFSWLSILG